MRRRGRRLPEGEDWKDHAIPCPHCDEPVLDEHEHYNEATRIDPGWWECDANHVCERCGEPNPERLQMSGCRDPNCPEQE